MTETNRYNNGKIYKLISPHTDKVYVGSTCKEYLCQRLAKHKNDYKFWLNKKMNYISSYELFELGDVEIVLLESVNCNTKDELLKKEREYTEKYKDIIVNKLRPITTEEENKEWKKQYREDNKEKIKQYYEKNKEHVKEYREANKEVIKQKQNKYYEENKEVIKQKRKQICDCECGKKYTFTHKARHTKSHTHQQYINSLVSQSVLKT
jgi:hypothetical protein